MLSFVLKQLKTIAGVDVRPSYSITTPNYPMIAVTEMDNYEDLKFTTIDNVERVSAFAIQLDIYARQAKINNVSLSAANAAIHYRWLADEIIQELCGMNRSTSTPPMPHQTDNTIMRVTTRYLGQINLDEEIIYKKGN